MRFGSRRSLCVSSLLVVISSAVACSGDPLPPLEGSSGAPGAAGAPSAGSAGAPMGGAPVAGAPAAGSPAVAGSGNVGQGGNLSAGSGGSATGGSSGSGPGTVSFSQVSSIIGSACGISGCHSAGATMPVLAAGATLHSTLMTRTVSRCGGSTLAKASDPANSALVKLLNKQCAGLVMPLGCGTAPCIPAADLATITSWIQAGAMQ